MPDRDAIDFSMFLADYVEDAKEGFQQINNALLILEKDRSQTQRLDEIFRAIHTLKSSSKMLEFSDIAELAHTYEDLLDRLRKHEAPITQETIDVLFEVSDTLETMVQERAERKGGRVEFQALARRVKKLTSKRIHPERQEAPETKTPVTPTIEKIHSVKVDMDALDSLFNLVGELILTKNRIDNIVSDTAGKELKGALATLDHIISELNEKVSFARLVPVDEIFQKFPRMVRDLARDTHKEVELVLEGSEIELDKAVLDAISEPLIHLLVNAVSHGIEPAQTRQQLGKKRSGTIKLAAKRAENHISIDVEDDGCGIDAARLKKAFAKQRPIEEVESLKDSEVLELLFEPGVSSADEVTEVSGRGVGLDVVRNSAKRLGGTVEVATQKGKGTRFTLKLPLTTAVLQTLMVGVGKHVFAIPTDVVVETIEINLEDIKDIQNEQVLVLRQNVIPFVKLNGVLNLPGQEDQNKLIAVIIHIGDNFLGLGVDEVVDQVESIVKPFDPIARQLKGFSGGTILGDGSVALLLDIPSLFGLETLQRSAIQHG